MATSERLEAKHLLKFKQMFAPGLLALAVPFPGFGIDVDLLRDVAQQRRIGLITDAQDDPRIAHVAEQNRKSQPVRRTATLPDER